MKLDDVLHKECIAVNARLSDKTEAIREVARLAKQSSFLECVDERDIIKGLEARESLGSTGIGKGIAIPHCRLKSVNDFVIGLITVPSGVDFDALDAEKVKLIVFIIAPEVASNKHVRLLSMISQKLLAPNAIDNVVTGQTPDAVYDSFLHDRREVIDDRECVAKSMIHVFIQNEDEFRDILQILSGIESGSLVIVGTENAGEYLSKLPLFASFWSDEPSNFGRIIIAVVNKNLTNETLRRIETVTGDLNKSASVMVTVQTIDYAAGSLST
jgi:mannitol/fructose-specific phosphotransferase system IIA component (Ntr-type)